MKNITFIILLIIYKISFATSYVESSVEELAEMSDLIVIGTISEVDMLDYKGSQVTDSTAMMGLTYPELDNVLRFHIVIEEVIFDNKKINIENTVITHLRFRRIDLGFAKEDYEGKQGIYNLRKIPPSSLNHIGEITFTSGRYLWHSTDNKEKILKHISRTNKHFSE